MACPKSPSRNAFYSEHITGTNQSYLCRIIGHIGTFFTVQHGPHFNDLTATVTLVTMSRHDRSRSNSRWVGRTDSGRPAPYILESGRPRTGVWSSKEINNGKGLSMIWKFLLK